MTALADKAAPPARQAPQRRADKDRSCPAIALLGDPRIRLGLGVMGVLVTALPVRADRVGQRETQAFHAVNDLPDMLYIPVWMVMQLGTLGAAPAAAAAAWAAGERRLAWRLAAGGSATWALAKLVKRGIRRPRPASLLASAHCRGPAAAGLGYLSGHAGVATALGAAAVARFRPAGRAVVLGVVPMVGLSRAYVGAHLPLDIVGGAALGLAVDAAVALVQQKER